MYLPIYTKPLWWYKYPDISEKNNIVSFIQSCRNENGGFGNYRNNPPYLENLFYASVILSLLNETDKITDSTISYLLKSQCKDGGFGELGAERSNLFNTFYAVTSLKIYDKITPEIREQVLRYLKQDILHQDGIYDLHVGIKNTTTMFWCIAVLKSIIINEPIEGINIYDELVEFCMQCYNSNIGLFSSVPNGISTIQNTYECLVILKECSSLKEVDSQKIYESIMKRKREALFFDDLMQSYTLSSSMWAILSLTILGKLNKIDTTDVLSHSVKILTKTRSIFDMFCAVNIMIDMLYEKSNVYVDNTAIIEEQGETVSLKNIKDMIIKMEKKGYNYLEYNFKDLLLESKIEESNKKDIFIQVLLKEHEQRIYEIEYDVKNNAIFSLVVPVTRVTNQCIEKRIISANKIILLGVFDALSDLPYSKNEEQIIKKYCLDNNFFNYTGLTGIETNYNNVIKKIMNGCHIFYYSGHSQDGNLFFNEKEIGIESILNELVENDCTIVILNCCDSYNYIKMYFEKHKYINNNLNVICTINDVSDKQAKIFITIFFRYLELGYPISESIRIAKLETYIENNGNGNIWWSYILFGNPFTIIDSS